MQLSEWVQSVAHEPWVFLLLLNVCLLLLGIFIEPLPVMLLTTPLFLPMALAFKIDLVHLGVVITANLAIALYTPPVGGTLFVAASIAKAGIGPVSRHLIPLMADSGYRLVHRHLCAAADAGYLSAAHWMMIWLLKNTHLLCCPHPSSCKDPFLCSPPLAGGGSGGGGTFPLTSILSHGGEKKIEELIVAG